MAEGFLPIWPRWLLVWAAVVAARVPGAAPSAAQPALSIAGRRALLVDGCNCGLRFSTGVGKKGVAPSSAQQARLLDCGGLKTQGASDLVSPIARWLGSNHAVGVCLMDGKADLGRHASKVVRPDANLEISFTAVDITADERILELLEARSAERTPLRPLAGDTPELGALLSLVSAAGEGSAAGEASSLWVQVEVRATAAAPEASLTGAQAGGGEISALRQGWTRPASHVYTLGAGSTELKQLAASLQRIAATPAAGACALRISRLRTSPVLCVTDDVRLRSACDRHGALVVAPRTFFRLIGVR